MRGSTLQAPARDRARPPAASRRYWINPLEFMARTMKLPPLQVAHIRFDPAAPFQYQVIRGSTHDGTLLFSQELLYQVLGPLIDKRACYKPMEQWEGVQDLRYTVGKLRVAIVQGTVHIPAGWYRGQRERVSLPVYCEALVGGEWRSA